MIDNERSLNRPACPIAKELSVRNPFNPISCGAVGRGLSRTCRCETRFGNTFKASTVYTASVEESAMPVCRYMRYVCVRVLKTHEKEIKANKRRPRYLRSLYTLCC